MEDVNKILNFYSTKLSNQIKKLSEPLQALELDGFWYSCIRDDGGFFQIGNRPDVAEVYFSNRLHVHNPFVCHPKNYHHNQAIMTGGFPDGPFQRAQKVVGERLGFHNIFFIYKGCGAQKHGLHFSSSKPNLPLDTIFLRHSNLLSSFADYFLQQWQENSRFMDSFMIDIASDMGEKFYQLNPKIQRLHDKAKTLSLVKEMGLLDAFAEALTAREEECAKEYLLGKTAGQIAAALGISRRTAEHHIENIKAKLGCTTKPQLFEKLEILQQFNLFSA